MWVIGYLFALVVGGASLGVGIYLLPTSQPAGLGFIAFGVATILGAIFVFIAKKPWVMGPRLRSDEEGGFTAEWIVIFLGLIDWEVVVLIAIYVVSFVVTYLIGYLA
jgi:hypothetical protein